MNSKTYSQLPSERFDALRRDSRQVWQGLAFVFVRQYEPKRVNASRHAHEY